ncbi:MAG: hypothetical protein GAK45_01743 [Pseudomonas citronellolis]|nr:MAG: hypothetical protein GAK45_01743 [Pseudomonas citronellolis]
MTIAELFIEQPMQWGLRGDPWLWREIAEQLGARPLPDDEATLIAVLGERFQVLTGVPLEHSEPLYLARHAHGGMSSGMISPSFWREVALPLLCARWQQAHSQP